MTSKTCTEHVVCPLSLPFQHSYIFIHVFPFPLALSIFLVEAAEEVFEIIAGLFFSRLQFGSVAVKHDSRIAAFAMADGFDPSGLSWD